MLASTDLVFLLGTFAAAFVTGLSGFAFGMVAAAVWLQVLAPADVAVLIVANALLVQAYAVWRLRRNIVVGRLWPFLIGKNTLDYLDFGYGSALAVVMFAISMLVTSVYLKRIFGEPAQ